jgi:DNA-binding CsgD family transcriptional regulator
MEGVQRLSLDGRNDHLIDSVLRFWSATRENISAQPLIEPLRQLTTGPVNLYLTEMNGESPLQYRLTILSDAFDLRYNRSYLFGDYPDQRYVESHILPSYAALSREQGPIREQVRSMVQGRYAVYERLMLPYGRPRNGEGTCLSLSRLLLLVEDAAVPNTRLSPREEQCLRLLAQGKSAKMMAAELGLAQKTVEHCIGRLKNKLQAQNVAQAVTKGMLMRARVPHPDDRTSLLSERERQCLGLLMSGQCIHEMAACLALSARTVEKYLESLKVKLHARNAAELAARGLEMVAGG